MNVLATGIYRNRIADWTNSRSCLHLGFLWGFSESIFFFLVPDILLSLTALFSFRNSIRLLMVTTLGAVLGGAFMFYAGKRDYPCAESFVLKVPFVSQKMFETTSADFKKDGILALCKGPASGIPYKVYSIQCSAYSGISSFLLVSIPARLERFLLTWSLFGIVGFLARRIRMFSPKVAVLGHGAYWIVVYIGYWSLV